VYVRFGDDTLLLFVVSPMEGMNVGFSLFMEVMRADDRSISPRWSSTMRQITEACLLGLVGDIDEIPTDARLDLWRSLVFQEK
jgi:hypothetical protein